MCVCVCGSSVEQTNPRLLCVSPLAPSSKQNYPSFSEKPGLNPCWGPTCRSPACRLFSLSACHPALPSETLRQDSHLRTRPSNPRSHPPSVPDPSPSRSSRAE